MALLQNGYRDFSSGVRIFGATASNNAYPSALQSNFWKTSTSRNFTDGEGITNDLAGMPGGYRNEYTYLMPQKNGAIKSAKESNGVATAAMNLAGGKNATGTADGVATVSGTAQLVVSGSGTAAGVATVSGNVLAALAASGEAAGVATASGAITALAWAVGSSAGVATASGTRYATGALSGSIAPAVDLEASLFSTYLLDSEDVETGMTLREALRIVLAASGGKVAISGDTVTIRDVNDTVDRITATTDTNGQRTAVTLDAD
jgi:hypothetical protein